jgi:hypothetical protein
LLISGYRKEFWSISVESTQELLIGRIDLSKLDKASELIL